MCGCWAPGKKVSALIASHYGHEFEQNLGDSEGQGSLACYSTWGCKELDATERLNKDHLERLSGNTNVPIDNGDHVPKAAQDFRFV